MESIVADYRRIGASPGIYFYNFVAVVSFLEELPFTIYYYTVLVVYLFSLIAYAFSRIFLVVEVFVSLRRLPETAYQAPSWTQWIPHL